MNNMGNTESKPPPAPLRVDDPYPTNAGADGVSLSMAEACAQCKLSVVPGISSSTVKLDRLFGSASPQECDSFQKAREAAIKGKMSFSDFKGQFKAGKLMSPKQIDGETYCEVRTFKDTEQEAAFKDAGELFTEMGFLPGNFPVVRVRKQATGGSFSLETKAIITPSIPFKMTFNRDDIPIKQMTLYHPCPVRIDAVQADAVLSLNDPSDTTNKYIILVPLVLSNNEEPSVKFFNKIVPSTSAIAEPNPITGQYTVQDVPTGNDWTLSQLFSTDSISGGNFDVRNGYFVWEGIPALERYTARNDAQVVRTSWRRVGSPGPTYILLEKPLQIGGIDLATLLRSLPVTPPSEAIHPIPERGVVYKQGPPEGCSAVTGSTTVEHYTELKAGESCDPFLNNALRAKVGEKQFGPQKFWNGFFYFLAGVAMLIGAYIAITMVLGQADQTVRLRAEDVGKVAAVWARGAKEKMKMMSTAVRSFNRTASKNEQVEEAV